jgi:site-specific DNA-methyltransferase (adenine-specific)
VSVLLGDCLEHMAALPDRSVDHVITDPPYEAEAHTKQRRVGGHKGTIGGHAAQITFAAMDEETRARAAAHMARLARRWIIVFCQIEAVQLWREVLEHAGATYKRAGFWLKRDGLPQLTGDRPGMGYETLVFAHADTGRSRWNGGGRHAVWDVPKHNPNPTGHQTEKPVALMEALVRDFTDPGEIVLDPFAGSGTTGVACKRLGRRFLGIEKNPEYHAIAQRRWEETAEQQQLIAASTPVPKPKQESLL